MEETKEELLKQLDVVDNEYNIVRGRWIDAQMWDDSYSHVKKPRYKKARKDYHECIIRKNDILSKLKTFE